MGVEQWSEAVVSLLAGLVRELCPHGLLLGHFKASLGLGAGFIYANTTGGSPVVRTSEGLPAHASDARLKVALIAYELDVEVVRKAFDEMLQRMLEGWELKGEAKSALGECGMDEDEIPS
jgi:hypothetical protein